MSNFACEKCGVVQQDSERGYVAGCVHYPPHRKCDVEVSFGGKRNWEYAVYDGQRFRRCRGFWGHDKEIKPTRWRMIGQ